MVLEGILNITLGPILELPNPYGLLILTFIITGIITIIYKFATDQKMMKALKEEIKEIQNDIKKFKDNPKKMLELQKVAMEKNFKYLKHSMIPTLITFLPLIIIFGWLRNYYQVIGNPKIFLGLSWLWTYIIFSIVISITLRKIMKVY
jgi:uncharacterized membrane protein (DUF106 family)